MCPNCGLNEDVIQHDGTGKFHCNACDFEYKVQSSCKIISVPDSLKEEISLKYKCDCGSRIVVETFSKGCDLFVMRWNLDLENPPAGFNDCKGLTLMDISCGKCGKLLEKDLEFLFDKEVNEKYGV